MSKGHVRYFFRSAKYEGLVFFFIYKDIFIDIFSRLKKINIFLKF